MAGRVDEKILGLVRRVKDFLVARYGNRIRQVILYGSCARGEQTEHSDVDILVIVDDSLKPFEVMDYAGDLTFDIMLETGEFLSVVVLPESIYREDSPFTTNVEREGVRV